VAPGDRARLLRRFAAAVDAHGEELAGLEVANAGHVIGNARWEAGNVRDVFEYYAAAPERHSGRQIPVPGGVDLTFHEPLGVVGIIVPWNFPMAIAGWGFAPALAAGNTVVLKPAELTPLSALRIGELALEAGTPRRGPADPARQGQRGGQRFVTHPAVRKICFTGSTEVGRTIMAGCADQVKRVTLELGGKSANIVFADADVELAAARAPYGVFDNAGQDCCARSRILVQRSVYERFLALLEPAVAGVVVGDPTSEATEMGPLISEAHLATVASFVPDGRPGGLPGVVPRRPGELVRPDGAGPGRPGRPVGHRGDLRAGGRRHPLRGRGRRRAAGQRHALRAVGVAVDPRRRPGPAGGPRRRDGDALGQLALVGPLLDAVRGRQAVGYRARARARRPRCVQRREERLHQFGVTPIRVATNTSKGEQ
jgi:acyl-CoA reductase-like NAD-dependent aldehyde dehydrogenase